VDFGFTAEDEQFRQEVRQFLAENLTPAIRAEMQHQGEAGMGPLTRELYLAIGRKGWIGMSWPKEYGGQEADPIRQFIFEEESIRAGVSISTNTTLGIGPVIMAVGTDEQKKYFLPRIIRAEVSFAIGFTEPSGGTDLASLKTRAVEDGDEFVINGQKVFTSGANRSTHIYLMARTDPDAPKHRGLSLFLVPTDAPGLTIRPLYTLPGGATCEVFLDDVRIPKSALLGEKNRGWYAASSGLNLDRAGAMRFYGYVKPTQDIIAFVKEQKFSGFSLTDDPSVRDKLAELFCEAQIARLFTWRTVSLSRRGIMPSYESSSEKVWGGAFLTKSTIAINQILGPYAQLWEGADEAPYDGDFPKRLVGAMVTTFGHGSAQVMRDRVAQRGLGQPRS
jgi:3-oxocholest-4-en-26-oyl-CoA dehydrogenase alpha subunit